MQKRVALCPHCGANLLEHGIDECLVGGTSSTKITFSNGSAELGETMIDNITDQWILCLKCNKNIDTGVTATDVINFADGAIDTIDELETRIVEAEVNK